MEIKNIFIPALFILFSIDLHAAMTTATRPSGLIGTIVLEDDLKNAKKPDEKEALMEGEWVMFPKRQKRDLVFIDRLSIFRAIAIPDPSKMWCYGKVRKKSPDDAVQELEVGANTYTKNAIYPVQTQPDGTFDYFATAELLKPMPIKNTNKNPAENTALQPPPRASEIEADDADDSDALCDLGILLSMGLGFFLI